jgi:hypothetical protein
MQLRSVAELRLSSLLQQLLLLLLPALTAMLLSNSRAVHCSRHCLLLLLKTRCYWTALHRCCDTARNTSSKALINSIELVLLQSNA